MTKLPPIAEILPAFIAAVLLIGIGKSMARAVRNKFKKPGQRKLCIAIVWLLLILAWLPLTKIILVVLSAIGAAFL